MVANPTNPGRKQDDGVDFIAEQLFVMYFRI